MTTSLLRCVFALFHEADGDIRPFGNQYDAVEKTGAGVQCKRDRVTVDPADGWVAVWDGTVAGALRDWSAFALRIKGSGTLHLRWTTDTPVSESNLASSGSAVEFLYDAMSCLGPSFHDNNRVYARDGVSLAKRYRLYAKTTETDPVTLDYAIME